MYEQKPNDLLFVEDILTPLSEAQAAYYLKQAYIKVIGEEPSLNSLSILWAQSALETFRWRKIHCNNWANEKKMVEVKYTSYKCDEIINGKREVFVPFHPQTFFSAWDSPLDGAVAYLQFLSQKKRYQPAFEQVKQGNAVKYCAALKSAGFFTADLVAYTKGVVSLTNEFIRKSAALLSWTPPVETIEANVSEEPNLIVEPKIQEIEFVESPITTLKKPDIFPGWLIFILEFLKRLFS